MEDQEDSEGMIVGIVPGTKGKGDQGQGVLFGLGSPFLETQPQHMIVKKVRRSLVRA